MRFPPPWHEGEVVLEGELRRHNGAVWVTTLTHHCGEEPSRLSPWWDEIPADVDDEIGRWGTDADDTDHLGHLLGRAATTHTVGDVADGDT